MKYAIKKFNTEFGTETQIFKFYDSKSRNNFLNVHNDAKIITAKENKKWKTTGTEYTLNKYGYVFFSRIVTC